MGYTTDFQGQFNIDHSLDDDTYNLLVGLSTTRRMKRTLGPEYGVDGEFYFDGIGYMGQDHDPSIVNHNEPPSTQPGLWCQWRPTDDRMHIEWNEVEKFYRYIEWIDYIIQKILKPKGYRLNGEVEWRGEDPDDRGIIRIHDNTITLGEIVEDWTYRSYESKYKTEEKRIDMEF